MNIGRMARDAYAVFGRHPKWVYEHGQNPSSAELANAIHTCIDGLQGPNSECSTGRFLVRCDDEGVIEVALILGSDYRGI